MNLGRRDFLQLLACASAGGLALEAPDLLAAQPGAADRLYDVPRVGNVSLLHFTDCHAQLRPLHFREPSVNLGVGAQADRPPHLVGEALLKAFGIPAHSPRAHAFTSLDFTAAARAYGKTGGFAHLATLVARLRASRPGALLLDGGDSWQGSATALWTKGQDMIDASRLLGVDAMTAHWEFTYGEARVQQAIERELHDAGIAFLAQNVRTADFGDPVFEPALVREIGGVPVAIVGQAFPYVPIAHPRAFVADWTFGLQEEALQKLVDGLRAKGAQLVVLLSHNGMDVDLKLASRVSGIDFILGGHTHDAVPQPIAVRNRGGITQVTNAGSHGKFLAVLDCDVRDGRLREHRYSLLPVFSRLLPPDETMQAHLDAARAPYAARLDETLATTQGLLYRRGNFNGSWDEVVLAALREVKGAPIAFSPGFRWGGTLLPGSAITREALMEQLAISYPETTLTEMTGATIKGVLEDVADNLFNPDPYYQQGGDMVRVAGLDYSLAPRAAMGARIGDLRLAATGQPLDATKTYKVAGWAPVSPEAKRGEPVWEVVETWLRAHPTVAPPAVRQPRLVGVQGNLGLSPAAAGASSRP